VVLIIPESVASTTLAYYRNKRQTSYAGVRFISYRADKREPIINSSVRHASRDGALTVVFKVGSREARDFSLRSECASR